MLKRVSRIVTSFGLALVLIGCSNGGAITNEQSFVSGNGVATFIKAESRKAAPELSGNTLQGEKFLSTRGTIQVVNVWASWCSPCRAEAPVLQELSTTMPEIQFVGILTRDNLVAARSFVTRFNITYPTLIDDSVILGFKDTLIANAIPTTLIIDKQGKVAARISGEVTFSGLRDLIMKVQNE